jgi:uncharacterized protein YecT (DUF1311 family)
LLALALVVAATLPPIREPFTPLPCPRKQVSTLDMEGCAERDILKTDVAVEKRERAAFGLLSSDGKQAFVRAERAWLTYRRATCEAEASRYLGGTIHGVVVASCIARENRTHLAALSALVRTLKQP